MDNDFVRRAKDVINAHLISNPIANQEGLEEMLVGLSEQDLLGIISQKIDANYLASTFANMSPGGCWRKRNEYGMWLEFFEKWLPNSTSTEASGTASEESRIAENDAELETMDAGFAGNPLVKPLMQDTATNSTPKQARTDEKLFRDRFIKSIRDGDESLYDSFVKIAKQALPNDVDLRYQTLKNHGYVAKDEADVDVYVVKVATRHIPKFKWLYDNLFTTYKEVFSKCLDVVVWGCGCGLDLLALYDRAMVQKNPQLWMTVRHITLIDISAPALERARTIASILFPIATIDVVSCDLRNPEDIKRTVSLRRLNVFAPRVHLISNLLDLFTQEEAKQFASTIKSCAGRNFDQHLYFNEFIIAFSPEYQGGRVAQNIKTFRDTWETTLGYASKVLTVGDMPMNCEFCSFSYRTLQNDKIYQSYMRGKNQVLNQMVSKWPYGNDLYPLTIALAKLVVCGKNFYRTYKWMETGQYKGVVERLVFVPDHRLEQRVRPCVIEMANVDEGKSASRGLKCLEERQCGELVCVGGNKEDFVVLFWKNGKLYPVADGLRDDSWQYSGTVDYSLYFRIDPGDAEPLPDLNQSMDERQREVIYSRKQYRKIRGGAGCGKSTTMMWHAIMAIRRTHLPVLIVCKTVTLFNRNAKRMAATLLREIPELTDVDSRLIKFKTLDKVLCEHMKERETCMWFNICSRCEGCNHEPVFGKCADFRSYLEYRQCENENYSGKAWREMCEEEKRRCCEVCRRESLKRLVRKGSKFATESEKLSAVLIDEVQSVEPALVQAVVNLTHGGNPMRECYVFCDERQSLNPQAVEIDPEKGKLRVKVPDHGAGYGNWIDLNIPYRASNDFSGRLVDVAAKLQALTIQKYGAVELARIVGDGQMSLSSSAVFSIQRSEGNLFDELSKGIKMIRACGRDTITIICDNPDDVRQLLNRTETREWITTHMKIQSHNAEQQLRVSFKEVDGRIHLTTVTLAQGWDFQNVIFVCCSERDAEKNVLEIVLTGATRATVSMHIIDRSKSGWLYDELKDFNDKA